jgi:hypothetical protein
VKDPTAHGFGSLAEAEHAARLHTVDHEHEAAPDAEFAAAWHDETRHAGHWFALRHVHPDEAALLLYGFDPLEWNTVADAIADAQQHSTNHTGPLDFMVLRRAFEDAEAAAPERRRALQEWLDLARKRELRFHGWIDEYLKAHPELRGEDQAPVGDLATQDGNTPAPLIPDGAVVRGSCLTPAQQVEPLPERAGVDAPPVAAGEAPAKAVPRHAAHEAKILDDLRRLGFDPAALPRPPKGRASPAKAAARAGSEADGMSRRVFDKAWQRLRADGRIAEA